RPRRLGHGALRLSRARPFPVHRAVERAALERRDGTRLARGFPLGPGAWRALAAAVGAHQSARLGSAARARHRLHPAAAGDGGAGGERRIRLRRPHLRRCGAVAAFLALRGGAAGPGLRDWLHPLPAGSRGLSLLLARREASRPRAAAVMIISLLRNTTGSNAPIRQADRSRSARRGLSRTPPPTTWR